MNMDELQFFFPLYHYLSFLQNIELSINILKNHHQEE